jgi:hypothetical protein
MELPSLLSQFNKAARQLEREDSQKREGDDALKAYCWRKHFTG